MKIGTIVIAVLLLILVVVPAGAYTLPDDPPFVRNVIGTTTPIPTEKVWNHTDYQNAIAMKELLKNSYTDGIVFTALIGIPILVLGLLALGGGEPKFGITLLVIGIMLIAASFGTGKISAGNDAEIAKLRLDDENSRPKLITPAYSYNETVSQKIASLNDGSMTAPTNLNVKTHASGGLFFTLYRSQVTVAGGGTVLSYFFYKIMPDDEYMIGSIPAEGVYLREDGDVNPRIDITTQYNIGEKKTYLDTNETVGGMLESKSEKITIHVPKGTVVRDFVADTRGA